MEHLYAFKSIGAHWIALYGNGDGVGYYHSLKESKKIKIQPYDLIMCEYFCIGFIVLC